jgi:hypothetical protein
MDDSQGCICHTRLDSARLGAEQIGRIRQVFLGRALAVAQLIDALPKAFLWLNILVVFGV